MTIDEILALSAELDVAHSRVDELFKHRDRSTDDYAAWFKATREMASAFERLYYGAEFQAGYQALKEGNAQGVDLAITFLEADPWSFRSGYIKADVLRYLKRVQIDDVGKERLRRVILNVVDGTPRREFRSYCRMAIAVDSASLRDALRERLNVPPPVGRHAAWMLQALDGRSTVAASKRWKTFRRPTRRDRP